MKFIILDRDGVINYDSDYYIKSPDEWIPIPGSLEAIAELNRAGYRVIVATNQSGVARGHYDLATLQKIHEKFLALLADVGGKIEEIFFCPHHPDEKCHCRKPQPGLFQQIQTKYAVNLADTYFVGDSYTDILVAQAAGCKPVLVMTGNGKKTLEKLSDVSGILQFADLAAVAANVIKES